MNPVNHAATALLIKKKWPDVPLFPTLIAVELIDILWVVFNLIGVEKTNLDAHVNSLKDIHFDFMPYSHSVLTTCVISCVTYCYCRYKLKSPTLGLALSLGIASHVVLDILTHAKDVQILPWMTSLKLGTGLYGEPIYALMVELLYCLVCWKIYGGSRKLLTWLFILNFSCISFYIPALIGPENLINTTPAIFPLLIGIQLIISLFSIFNLARD